MNFELAYAGPDPLGLIDDEGGCFRFRTVADYVEELRAHGPRRTARCSSATRFQTIDYVERPAIPADIARMRSLADEALAVGVIGVRLQGLRIHHAG